MTELAPCDDPSVPCEVLDLLADDPPPSIEDEETFPPDLAAQTAA